LRGALRAVSIITSPDVEPALFSAQLQAALDDASVAVTPYPAPNGMRWVGTQICSPTDNNPADDPLWKALSAIGLDPAHCSLDTLSLPVPKNVPLIIVGDRKLFFPGGPPKSLRFRAYPGADPTRKQQ
jgi:hypothetical protein